MKRTERNTYLWQLLATLLLLVTPGMFSACSNDDTNTTPANAPEKNELHFDINSQQFTRATVITNNTELQGQALRIFAYHNGTTTAYISDAKLVYDSGWRFDDGSGTEEHYYWPVVGSVDASSGITMGSLDFVGYMPYVLPSFISSATYIDGNLSFICADLPMTSAGQLSITEFMCALQLNQKKDYDGVTPKVGENIGKVPMSFKHPFAYIKFQLAASHPDITINSITLKGLKTGGTCTFNGSTSTWSAMTPADETIDFVATLSQSLATSASVQTIGANYIVVPQTFGGEIVVNATWTDWGDQLAHTVTTTIPSVTWRPGSSYTYTFTITETDLIVDTSKFTEQW